MTSQDTCNPVQRSLLSVGLTWSGLVWVAALCGCTSLDLRGKMFGGSSDPKPDVPARMVDVWSEETVTQPGLPPVRGFGGRIMFYKADDNTPIKVDGTFVVFAFDEADRDNGYTAPEKKFMYRPEELSKYYSKSELGHSYNVWLPWDEVGGPSRKLCLIARFEPRKGNPVVSKPCHKTLSGVSPQPDQARSQAPSAPSKSPASGVKQASHEEPVGSSAGKMASAASPSKDAREITTFSIDVPRALARPGEAASSSTDSTRSSGASTSPQRALGDRSAMETTPASRSAAASQGLETSPSDRFARTKPLAQRGLASRLRTDPVRKQPLPARPLSALPATPRSDSTEAGQASSGAGESTLR